MSDILLPVRIELITVGERVEEGSPFPLTDEEPLEPNEGFPLPLEGEELPPVEEGPVDGEELPLVELGGVELRTSGEEEGRDFVTPETMEPTTEAGSIFRLRQVHLEHGIFQFSS